MNISFKSKMISTTSALWLFGALLFLTINPPLKAMCELATLNIESKTHLTIFCKSSFFPRLIISIQGWFHKAQSTFFGPKTINDCVLRPQGLMIWVQSEMTQIMVLIFTDITRRDFVSVC